MTFFKHMIRNVGWRTSFGNISNWLTSTTTTTVENANVSSNEYKNTDDENKTNAGETIPKLPVPDLQHTLTRYLQTLQPILNESTYNRTKCLVDEFGRENGIGEKLQKKLLKRRESCDNWAYDWWLDDMYLNNQLALPINSNPGMVWPLQNFNDVADMAKFAAKITYEAVLYKRTLDGNCLQQETIGTGDRRQPLCMAQYYRIFTTYRVPGVLKDTQLKSETDFTKARPHIVVACRNQFYALHLTKGEDAELLTEGEIAAHMLRILEENVTIMKRRLPVGILTTLKRDKWGEIRELLIADENNRKSIAIIEKSLLIVCFDLDEIDDRFNKTVIDEKNGGDAHKTSARDETSMAHQMIHGCGSFSNSGNRWFDKTIQIIIGKDGANGLCYEHSPAEGVAVINAMQVILDDISEKFPAIRLTADAAANSTSAADAAAAAVETLNWNLTDTLQRHVHSSKKQFDECVKNLDFNVFRYNGYGKEFIKLCRCSPDAYIQLALQYTYYRLNGKLCATYESASTRRFRLGRVDCIRANTMEALRWVSAMTDNRREFSMENKLNLFDEAMRKQSEITTENINGLGIDIHLLGLRQLFKNEQLQRPNENIFNDETYTVANHFALSTSQVATKENSFMGYGPVVPNGYGASYNPKENGIIFCISSFKSDPTTNTDNFVRTLHASLNSMKDLLQKRNRAT